MLDKIGIPNISVSEKFVQIILFSELSQVSHFIATCNLFSNDFLLSALLHILLAICYYNYKLIIKIL